MNDKKLNKLLSQEKIIEKTAYNLYCKYLDKILYNNKQVEVYNKYPNFKTFLMNKDTNKVINNFFIKSVNIIRNKKINKIMNR